MSFIKRLFGFFSASSEVAPEKAPSVPTPQAPVRAQNPTLTFAWQELIDRKSSIAGYLLQPISVASSTTISGAELADALVRENIGRITHGRTLIVPMTSDQWTQASFQFAASSNTYFHLLDLPLDSDESVRLGSQIVGSGVQLVTDSSVYMPPAPTDLGRPMLLFALDAQPLNVLEQMIRRVRAADPQTKIIVNHVATWAEFRFLMSIGVTYCMGSFATTAELVDNGKEISQSRLVLLEILNLLRNEGDTAEIAKLAKRDPVIVIKLLEMANSPLAGLSRRVETLEEAVFLLGRENLYRWIALAVFRIGTEETRDETLMTIALCRAAFLEALAPEDDAKMSGELFLVGMFSLLESLLQVPISAILGRLQLPEHVTAVLARSEGPYARFLMLALAMERCRVEQVISLCELLDLPPAEVFGHYRDAMSWATK